jgi:hypothetical protein
MFSKIIKRFLHKVSRKGTKFTAKERKVLPKAWRAYFFPYIALREIMGCIKSPYSIEIYLSWMISIRVEYNL